MAAGVFLRNKGEGVAASNPEVEREPHDEERSGHDRADVATEAEQGLASLLEEVCADQVQRWHGGERVSAEEYLARNPILQSDSASAFELVYGEFVLRESLGETPALEEYLQRFPQFAAQLKRQLDLHQALQPEVQAFAFDRTATHDYGGLKSRLGGDGRIMPGYVILGELGHGGMGVVYKARQVSLNRIVALKVLRADHLGDHESVARFRAESEAAARLQHPNIVQVFEVGEHEGMGYLALEYVPGGSLEQAIASTPQDPRSSAMLLETVARAVHYAHDHGIVHRDLKPANILLAVDSRQHSVDSGSAKAQCPDSPLLSTEYCLLSTPKITDFGLAKLVEQEEGPTQFGAIVGTPSYMAPEQAQGGAAVVTPATDVYALGAILYELLTGRPPFKGTTPLSTLEQVRSQEPLPPGRLQRHTPRDLETICLKCLEKELGKRYGSAELLAEDLRRFLNNEPILARPTPTWKWAKRRPMVTALLLAIVLVSALGFSLVAWQWRRAESKAIAEAAARQQFERLSAGMMLDQGSSLCGSGEVGRGLLWLVRALELATHSGDEGVMRAARYNLASWQPFFIRQRASFPHTSWVWAVAFSPDGRTALTGSEDRTARRWDVGTGRALGEPLVHTYPIWEVAFSPDGKIILTGSGDNDQHAGEARLWNAVTGQPLCAPLLHPGRVTNVAFSPDGLTFLTVCNEEARLWSTANARLVGAPLKHPKPEQTNRRATPKLTGVFSSSGKIVATGGEDGTVRLWDAGTAKPLGQPLLATGPVLALAFSPDGRTLLSGVWTAAPSSGM
ncbi:MAG TPA: serine/threonine-protein kinase [Gemmataceae bacterium]|nr:serine/threonine-protein kinase [Gemmataceae bacterium]